MKRNVFQELGNFSRTEGKNLTIGKEQAAENLITWTTNYMRLYVTEMHINKSYQGLGSSATIRSSDLMENTILIYYNKACQRKNPDPTTGNDNSVVLHKANIFKIVIIKNTVFRSIFYR